MKRLCKGPGILALALLMTLIASLASAAAPTFQAAGNFEGGGGALTGASALQWPTHQAGDVGLLIVETANQVVTLGTNGADWTQVTDSPQGTGTPADINATRLTVFWSRATSSSMGAVGVLDSGDHQAAQILTFRGVIATGNPWDVTAGDVLGSANVNVTIPGDTTTVANTLVVAIVASGIDVTSTAELSGWANADLSTLTERADGFDKGNNGGGFGVATGVKVTAGTYAPTTATLATSANAVQGRMSIALKPPAAAAPNPGYFLYRKKITIDHLKVGNSGAPTTLADYPFLFNVTDADLATVSNGGHVSNTVKVDAVSSNSAGAAASSLTISNHTTSGENRLMLVGISISKDGAAGARQVTSVTYNGVGLTEVCTGSVVGDARVWIYKLMPPPVTTADVVITLDGTVNTNLGSIIAGVMTFAGVDQTTPLGTCVTDTNNAAPHEVTVTSATNELVFDVYAAEDAPLTMVGSPAGRTQRWNITSNTNGGGGSTAPGAASVTMTWTADANSSNWAVAGVPIKPAASAAGNDIIFRALDDTTCNVAGGGENPCTLDHEIEEYDPTTGKLVAWVRIPSVKAFSYTTPLPVDTEIYIYYGNDQITSSTQNPTGVWATKYKAVWHLHEDVTDEGTTGTHVDSTSNDNDGTQSGNVEIAGKIARGQNFDGSNDRIQVPDVTPFELRFNGGTEDFTLMAWIKRAATGSEHYILSKEDGSNDGYYLRVRDVSQDTLKGKVNSQAHNGSGTIDTNWHLVVLSINRSGNGQLYLDGVANGSPVSISNEVMATTAPVYIGSMQGSGSFFNGIIDEARIVAEALSAHWIKAEYNNMSLLSCGGAFPFDATEFAICDGEETNPPSAVKLRGARAVAYEGSYAQTVQLKWRTSHEVDHLGFHVYREQAGQLLQLTPSLIAGSALLARGRTELTAGQRYSWWDVLPTGGGPLQYWLEEVDLHGQRTWHGPIAVSSAKGRRDLAKPEQVRSVLLSKLGRGKHKGRLPGAPWQGAADAATQTPTAAQWAMQTQLAAGPAIKLGVSAEGWYRVDQPSLIAAGLDPKVDPRRLRLYADGREVPTVVTGGQDGRLDPRDAIAFYGMGLETPWTDTRTYWLVEGSQAGQRISARSWQGRTQPGPASFPFTVTWQPRELYFAALRNGEADNFFGPVVGNWPTEQALTLNYLDPAPPAAARLEVTLQGVTDGPHAVDVQVNGTSVGTVTFDGQGQGRADLSVPSSQLQAGANLVTLMALSGEMDISLVATVRLTYWHSYTAEEDVLRGSVPAGQQVTIGGFSTKPISVVDVTEPDAVRAVPGQVARQGSSFAVTVVSPGPGTRTLLAFTDRVAATPAKIHANQPSQWHRSGHRGEMVMIGHPAFLPSLATLKAWREQQGWTVALIDVEDLYDEFTFGAKSPVALRALVETARASWAQPPRFLLLGGDASFDPRDTQGMGETDFVPTKLIDTDMMETASDDWFGDLNGDGVAEVAVGRLAVRTAEEATTVVQKLIGYDQTAAPRTALLVADTPDSLDFEGASTRLAALLPSGMASQAIYRSQSDDATTRGTLLAAFNSGAWLVNYLGHGSVEVWRGEVFTSLDASTLTNGLRLPFVSTMTCLNGFFHDVWTESLAEALQRAPQGGALAVWASSSLSQAPEQVPMNRALLQGLSAGLTLGEAVAQAKAVARHPDVRRTWILFGDPTSRLK